MSKMFMDALEKHIGQLEKRSSATETATRDMQRKQIHSLLETATDGRFRRSLNNALRKLDQEAPRKNSGPNLLPQLKELHALLDHHPDYRKKRRKRTPKAAPESSSSAVEPTAAPSEPDRELKINRAFFGR